MVRVAFLAGLWVATLNAGEAGADSSGTSLLPRYVLLFQNDSAKPLGMCLHRFSTGQEVWAARFGEIESLSWPPPVARGRVLLVGRVPGAQSVDLLTGKVVWRFDATVEARLPGEDAVVIATPDRVVRLDPSNGRTLWTLEGGAARASLWRSDDVLVRIDREGALSAHDMGTARRLWRFGERIPGFYASVGDGVVVARGERSGKLHGLDLRTGRTKWEIPAPGERARPHYWEGRLSVYTADRGMWVLDPLTGLEKWSNASIDGVMRWTAQHLFVRTRQGEYACLDAVTGRTLWELRRSESRRAQIVNASFAVTLELGEQGGVVSGVDPAGDRVLWSLPPTRATISPLIVDSQVYQAIQSPGGRAWTLRCLEGGTGEVRWSTPLQGNFGRIFSMRKWLVASEFEYVSAMEASTGRALWRAKCSHASDLGGGSLYPR